MSTRHRTHPTRQEIGSLNDETSHLDSRITDEPHLVSWQKTTLAKRLNPIQPPIGRLPREVLSEIFKALVLPSAARPHTHIRVFAFVPEEFKYIFVLGAVSSLWREVVFSTPSLWTYFRWSPEDLETETGSPSILRYYLKNSGTLSIHLELHFFGVTPEDGSLFHPSVDEELLENMSKIKTLLLHQPPAIWDGCLSKLTTLVNLVLDREDLPSLSHQGDILDCCRDLVELSLTNLWESDIEELDSTLVQSWCGGSGLVFKQLEMFEWESPRDFEFAWDWVDLFLNEVHMPALRTLILSKEDMGRASERYFLDRHAPTISTLRLELFDNISKATYAKFFALDSPLECVTLLNYGKEVLTSVAAMLTADNITNPSRRHPLPAPRLKSLALTGRSMELLGQTKLKPSQYESLISMLEQRLAVGGGTFHLEFSYLVPDWTDGVQERLISLVKRGVKLDIVEDGYRVGWLES
ncbi:hypothetical protein D9756_007186 [Leucocoprinus leucothites]|uniref:F-box domain-containing protein n=1 Tax=Leucocoprinus leucothites TaxID=201217 RepID=A0A8H5D5G4_9AGAR|nr:hypothetical protein D9756_007186 [Leucoagaricus leucothites]